MEYNERTQCLNDSPIQDGNYVLYWMQQAQRAEWNHALERAIREANKLELPLLAAFGITQRFPGANQRHYSFMLEGLHETTQRLRERGIRLLIRLQPPAELISELARRAALLVTDRGYLRIQKQWRRRVARSVPCRMLQVETDVVVPVEIASPKEEYAARTIRPKIHEHLEEFLRPIEHVEVSRGSLDDGPEGLELSRIEELLQEMRLSRHAVPVSAYHGGAGPAQERLKAFLRDGLTRYEEDSRDPNADCVSHLSPYLHFGQISPLQIALKVQQADSASEENRQAFLEQLIVRRELSFNLCRYNDGYDSFDCLPEWARETLQEHASDDREYIYSPSALERSQTHDPYWNAAQTRMVHTGYMHNYMRMYWGKKILEWTESPQQAFDIALELNNRYELDGRDPCSFANVAWCFGKHDQGWKERPIFGKVRYMNARGLERKFDMDRYLKETPEIVDSC
jgi:deoxyribodipyrimidine photo-lyase